jgi:hypothetical protein
VHPTQDVHPQDTSTGDTLKTERISAVDDVPSDGVVGCDTIAQRQPAGLQNPVHTPAPAIDVQSGAGAVHELDAIPVAPSKTGKSGNAVAPGGRDSMGKVRFSDFEGASAHQVDQPDAPASAAPPAAANNRKWGAIQHPPLLDVKNGQRPLLHAGERQHRAGYQRQRDTDMLAAHWDSDRGEFLATGPP